MSALPEALRVILFLLTTINGGENINRHEVMCLSQAVYFESRNQSILTQIGIASFVYQFSVRNNTTICEEVYESPGVRYSWTKNYTPMDLENDVEHEAWETAVFISALTINGSIKNDVGDATHFIMPKFMKDLPGWYDPELVVFNFGVVEYLRLPDYK